MKYILKITILLAIGWLAVGCGDKGYDVSETPTFAVKDAQVEYTAAGGSGTITLEIYGSGTPSVSSEKEWCRATLSGSKINLEVDAYAEVQSRESAVTIFKDGYKRTISIYQLGTIVHVEDTGEYLGPEVGDKLILPFTTNGLVDVSIAAHSNWVDAVLDGNTIVITATEKGTWPSTRTGNVTLRVNDSAKAVSFVQRESSMAYEAVIGDYVMTAYNVIVEESFDVYILPKEHDKTFTLTGLEYDIELSYKDEVLSFNVGQKVGTHTVLKDVENEEGEIEQEEVTYDVLIRLVDNTLDGSSATTSRYMYSTYELIEGQLVFTLKSSSTSYTGFGFYYVEDGTPKFLGNKYRHQIMLYKK